MCKLIVGYRSLHRRVQKGCTNIPEFDAEMKRLKRMKYMLFILFITESSPDMGLAIVLHKMQMVSRDLIEQRRIIMKGQMITKCRMRRSKKVFKSMTY